MDENANYRININLHVLILFTFLTLLFFTYISKLERESISNVITSSINDNIGTVLTKINNSQVTNYIDWDSINKMSKDIQTSAKGEAKDVTSNHRRLLITGILIIVGLTVYL